jgi:hypothetical protein
VDENSAAAAGDARPRVVIDLNKQIIQPIAPPKAVAWFIGRSREGTIIPPIGRIFTPSIGRSDTTDWQQCTRTKKAVGPPPQPQWAKQTARRRAVTLALVCPDPGAPDRNRHDQMTGANDTL